jgi:hypothetical protein
MLFFRLMREMHEMHLLNLLFGKYTMIVLKRSSNHFLTLQNYLQKSGEYSILQTRSWFHSQPGIVGCVQSEFQTVRVVTPNVKNRPAEINIHLRSLEVMYFAQQLFVPSASYF